MQKFVEQSQGRNHSVPLWPFHMGGVMQNFKYTELDRNSSVDFVEHSPLKL